MAVFDPQNVDPDADPRSVLIGEGKKYANEDEALKALLNAQLHIPRLEQEREEQRTEFDRLFSELQLYKEAKPLTVEIPQPVTPKDEPPAVVKAPDDLQEMIRQALNQDRQAEMVKRNTEKVVEGLVSIYGDEAKANEAVRQKAAELGVSVEFLQDVAAKSPTAFFATIGANVQPQATPQPTKGDVRPSGLAPKTAQEGTWSFFQQVKENNPKAYWTANIQNQLHKAAAAAAAKGIDFYST